MKFKSLIWIIVILTLSSFASTQTFYSIEYLTEADCDYFGRNTAVDSVAQNFSLSYDSDIVGVKFKTFDGYSAGTVGASYITIETNNNGIPSGTIISDLNKTTGTIAANNIYEFNFTTKRKLTANIVYWLVLRPQTGIADGNYVCISRGNNGLATFNMDREQGSGWEIRTYDMYFGILSENITIPTITYTYPNTTYNETYNNYNGWVNVTTDIDAGCIINDTRWIAQAASNATHTYTFYNTNYASLSDGNYTINVSCKGSAETSAYKLAYFKLDTTLPTITSNTSSTYFVRWNRNYTTLLTFSDNTLLWGYNISMNGILKNHTSNLGVSSFQYNFKNDSWVIGANNITTLVYDAHTALETSIKENELSKVGDSLKVGTTLATSLTTVDRITYIKNTDRYNFCYYYKTPTLTAQIQMPNDCVYQNREDLYKGWFVCPNMQWWDFENNDYYNIDVKNNIVTATSDKETDRFCFNSVGSLNENSANYTYWGWNDTVTFDSNELESTSTTFNLTLTSYNQTFDSAATFLYNGTYYATTQTNGTTTRVHSVTITTPNIEGGMNATKTGTFNFTINGAAYTTSMNQIVYNILLDNCTLYPNFYALNITINDENTGAKMYAANISYDVEYLSGTTTTHLGHSISANETFFCIYPSFANISGDITLQYSSSGYGNREYIQTYYFDSASEAMKLYLLPTASATTVTIHVIDDSDQDLSNVLVEVYRWDVDTDTYSNVGSELTNDNGNVQFGLYAASTYYKFKFYQSGVLKIETSPFKIFDTTLEYIISDTEASVLEEWLQVQNILYNLTYYNSSKMVNFSWYDAGSIADLYCLNITDNNQSYYNSCSSSNSGTLSYTITTFNRTYTAIAHVRHATSGKYYNLKILGINLYDTFKSFIGGTESLMYGLVVFLSMSMIGLYNSAMAIVLGVGSLVILYWLQIVPFTQVAIMGLAFIAAIIIIIISKRGF